MRPADRDRCPRRLRARSRRRAIAARPRSPRRERRRLPCAAGRPRLRSRPAGRRPARSRSRGARHEFPVERASLARRSRSRALAGRPGAPGAPAPHPAEVRAARRQLEQDTLPERDPVEATYESRDTHRERRSSGSARDDDLRRRRTPDLLGEEAAIELVQAKPAPPEPGGRQRKPDEGEPRRRSEAEGGGGCGNRRDCSGHRRRYREPVRKGEPDCKRRQRDCGPASLDRLPDADHGVTRSRSCSTRAGPIPGIASRYARERGYSSALRPDATSSSWTSPSPPLRRPPAQQAHISATRYDSIPVGSIQPNDTSIRIPHGP